ITPSEFSCRHSAMYGHALPVSGSSNALVGISLLIASKQSEQCRRQVGVGLIDHCRSSLNRRPQPFVLGGQVSPISKRPLVHVEHVEDVLTIKGHLCATVEPV